MSESLLLCSSFIFSLCRACVSEESHLKSMFWSKRVSPIPSESGEPALQSKGSYQDAPKLQTLKISRSIKTPNESLF